MRPTRTLPLIIALAALAGSAPMAIAQRYAPTERPGPALRPSPAQVRASLSCSADLAGATRDPVLLLSGTSVNSAEYFAWNYTRALRAVGVPTCTSDLPVPLDDNLGELQLRGEYVVGAIREIHRRSGRKVAIFGHSQGGSIPRWAMRWWPDVRTLVSDVIGAAPSNHGTLSSKTLCAAGPCAPAAWQQAQGSAYLAALNSEQETFSGVDYTTIATRYDEIVIPPTSARLSGPGRITNVLVQSLCPGDASEHFLVGTADSVTWALVRDALEHDGPADPARIDRAVCAQPLMPGVDGRTLLANIAATATASATSIALGEKVAAEPRLECYVYASCRLPSVAPARCTSRRRFIVRSSRGLRDVRMTLGGRSLKVTRRDGRATAVVDLRGRHGTFLVRIWGRTPSGRTVSQTRRYRTCVSARSA